MHSAFKSISIVALTASVLTATACSSSGTISPSAAGKSSASSAPSTSTPSTSAASTSTAATSPSPATTTSSTPSAPPTTSSGDDPGEALTIDQIRGLLLTDRDDPGYTYDASKDDTRPNDTQHAVTGNSDCQQFADATNALTTKYGTTIQVARELGKSSAGHEIRSAVAVLPSVDSAKALVFDLTASLKGCKALTTMDGDQTLSMQIDVIPQLVKDGQVGYVSTTSAGGDSVLVAVELIRVGTAVSWVGLVGPSTSDAASLAKMGATLSHLSDIQAARVKEAEGLT